MNEETTDTSYIELEDGTTITVIAMDGEVTLVIPNGGAHILDMTDAHRVGAAICKRATQARDTYAVEARQAHRLGAPDA